MPRNRNPTQIGRVYGKAALNAFFFIPQIDFLSFISTLYFTFSVCDCQECVLSFFCNRFHHKSVYKNRHMFHVKHIAVRYYNYTFFNSRFSSSMTVSPSFISLSYSSLSLCRRLISCPLQQNFFSKTFICVQTIFHQADKTSSFAACPYPCSRLF